MADMVRTRFAPSPTGYMHIGNLRSALYTWLYARHHGGKFILRIEDTDRNRYVEGATEVIYRTLKSIGMNWDEGPDVGGEFGPYVQSERKDMYLPYAKRLVEMGKAYYCFCTNEELGARRAAASEYLGALSPDVYTVGLQGHHKALAIGVAAVEPAVVVHDRVDRADQAGALGDLVQIFHDRDLVGNGAVDAAHFKRLQAADSIAQLVLIHIKRQIAPPLQAARPDGAIQHDAAGILRHRLAEYANQMIQIILFLHIVSSLCIRRFRACAFWNSSPPQ